jgi:membrane-associated protein
MVFLNVAWPNLFALECLYITINKEKLTMELVKDFIELFLHLDKHLNVIIQNYGVWTYLLLFLVIFCETGLVVTPLLPGDSLLFAAGTFAALGSLKVELLYVLLAVAAIAGDTVNYWIGHYVGPKVFYKEDVRFLNKKYLDRTHEFYEKHGGKTIILARFIPIIRTFAPFVAGIGRMTYGHFISYNVIGGLVWIAIFLFGGYFFGNIPVVKNNFTLVVLAIIFISVMPIVIEFLNHRFRSARE